jgi:aminopeptidase N
MYAESLFIEYYYGKEAGAEYSRGLRMTIENREPLIGQYDVNKKGSSDMYNKGNNLLHTLRQIVNNDDKWRAMLRGLNKEFYHQTVTTQQVENYMAQTLGLKLEPFFDQYVRDYRIPVFEYSLRNGNLVYRWSNCIETFDMPLKIYVNGKEKLIRPTAELKAEKLESSEASVKVDPDFYVYRYNTMGE